MGKLLGFIFVVAGMLFIVWSTSDRPQYPLQESLNRKCEICKIGFADIVISYSGKVINFEPIGKTISSKLLQNQKSNLRAEVEIFRKNADQKNSPDGQDYILQFSIFDISSGNKLDEVPIEEIFKSSN